MVLFGLRAVGRGLRKRDEERSVQELEHRRKRLILKRRMPLKRSESLQVRKMKNGLRDESQFELGEKNSFMLGILESGY